MNDNHSVTSDQINQTFQDLLDEDHIMSESFQNVSNEKFLFFHSFSHIDQLEFDETKSDVNQFESNEAKFDAEQSEFDIEQFIDNEAISESVFIMRANFKRKLEMKDFTSVTQKKLLNIARKKLRSSIEDDEVLINIREKSYHTNYTIKYLHSMTRFFIMNVKLLLYSMKSSSKSLKSTSKSDIIRVYCDIARDNKRNKL
jgi:hypothetical protein